jgi:hypothetical protein
LPRIETVIIIKIQRRVKPMPRRSKSSKFFIYAPKKSGHLKGKMLLGVNGMYEGGTDSLTIQDLVDFLQEQGIPLSTVELPEYFMSVARV